MSPSPLDELPVHQAPLSMARVATSDRNFYDRCYLNAHDRTGEVFLVGGVGVYPNLGVRDGYVSVRVGDVQHTLRASDALDQRTAEQAVGPFRVEVLDPLERIRFSCQSDEMSADLHVDRLVPRRPGAAAPDAWGPPGRRWMPSASPR